MLKKRGITGLRETVESLSDYVLAVDVVEISRRKSESAGQRDRRESPLKLRRQLRRDMLIRPRTPLFEALHEFPHDVLRVGRASAVPRRHQLSAVSEAVRYHIDRMVHIRGDTIKFRVIFVYHISAPVVFLIFFLTTARSPRSAVISMPSFSRIFEAMAPAATRPMVSRPEERPPPR